MAYTHEDSLDTALLEHLKVLRFLLRVLVRYRNHRTVSAFAQLFLGLLDETHEERCHALRNDDTDIARSLMAQIYSHFVAPVTHAVRCFAYKFHGFRLDIVGVTGKRSRYRAFGNSKFPGYVDNGNVFHRMRISANL